MQYTKGQQPEIVSFGIGYYKPNSSKANSGHYTLSGDDNTLYDEAW